MKESHNKTSFITRFFSSLNTRLYFALFIVAFIPLFFLVMTVMITYRAATQDIGDQSIHTVLREHVSLLERELTGFSEDILSISGTPPIQGIDRAKRNGGLDPFDDSDLNDWYSRLSSIFSAHMMANDAYLQMRFIDDLGQEVVRVDRIDGVPVRLPEEQLQDKAGRYYVEETFLLSSGEVYVSPLDLNREGTPATIIEPHQPVIRYAIPVFSDETGELHGMLISNVLMADALGSLERSDISQRIGFTQFTNRLVDENGYYLFHPDVEKRFGSPVDLDTGESLREDLGVVQLRAMERLAANGKTLIHEGAVYGMDFVLPNPQDHSMVWRLVGFVDLDEYLSFQRELWNEVRLLVIFTVLFVLLSASILQRLISRPIRNLRKIAERIEAGESGVRSAVQSNDVVGDLAHSINSLADTIEQNQADLERAVAERTARLDRELAKSADIRKAVINILEDVDEEKAKFEGSFDSSAIGIALVGVSGEWLDVNDALCELVGYTREELLTMKFQDITHPDDLKNDLELFNEVMDGVRDTYQVQKRYLHKKGYEIWVLLSVSCIRNTDGSVKYFISQILDITKQREVDQAKTEFVSLASHQLRTPLTSINWYAEMLLEGDAGTLTDEQKTYINEIYKGNQRMVDLVNALLNVSRIELGTFMVEPVETDLVDLVDGVLRELKPTIETKRMQVDRDYQQDLPKIMLDPKLIRIVFQNLLTNALKYTPEEGRVSVVLKTSDTLLHAEVSDTGMGIPEAQKDKIFTKLFRADNVREVDADGTGFGLYIVKSIIESTGGTIRFESEEGKGTTFFVDVPLGGMAARKGSKPLEPQAMPKKQRSDSNSSN